MHVQPLLCVRGVPVNLPGTNPRPGTGGSAGGTGNASKSPLRHPHPCHQDYPEPVMLMPLALLWQE